METEPAFYVPEGPAFLATAHARGPWSMDHQHGGPPSALVGQALERAIATELGEGVMHPARLTIELIRPVPFGLLTIETDVEAGGHRVRRARARLLAGGREVLRARALFIRRTPVELPARPSRPAGSPSLPQDAGAIDFPFFETEEGYHASVELRVARGGFGQGHALAWIRARYPLVLGESLTPLSRVLVAADSGNGVSSALDHNRFLFINPDLTVTLHRLPRGEWIALDARTRLDPQGTGLAHSELWDEAGPIGQSSQTLLVGPR